MINRIRVKNFKSLKNIDISLSRLNVLSGLNGMGKSSFIHVLLTLKQSDIEKTSKLSLLGNLASIGKGLDALYQFATEDDIIFSFDWDEGKHVEYKFKCEPDSNALYRKMPSSENNHLDDLLINLQYISADRHGPSTLYDMSLDSVEEGTLGSFGQYACHFLAAKGHRLKVEPKRFHPQNSSPFLANQVNAWLGEISPGVKVNVAEVPGIDKMVLSYEFELLKGRTQPFKPSNVGYGISYALSVIVALLIARNNQIVIIENPEAHIHPRGQAELGKLMSLVAATGVQLFIETHSDHIINGIRVSVKKKHISNYDVIFPWFEKVTTDNEQYTDIKPVKVDINGELNHYPNGFLEEWNNQLIELV